MAEAHMSIDEKFRDVLTAGLAEHPPLGSRSVDRFILSTLNQEIFGPICEGALTALSQYGEKEIQGILENSGYEMFSFPALVFLDEQGHIDQVRQYALSYFFSTYDISSRAQDSASPALIKRKTYVETAKEELSLELQDVSLSPERRNDIERKISLLETQLAGIEFTQANYGQFVSDYARFIPQDSHERELFITMTQTAFLAADDVNYPLSDIAKTMYISPAQAIEKDQDYESHFIAEAFPTANWCADETITTDLLTTANIMLEVLPGLKELSASIAPENVEFVSSEVARAKDTPFEYSLLMTYTEGIFSIVQAINLGLGQQVRESNKTDENTLVHKILQSQIPQQMARILPFAVIGPVSMNGRYINNLLVEDSEGTIALNPAHIALGKERKASIRNDRHRRFGDSLSSVDAYLKRDYASGIGHPSLSTQGGNVCPVTLPSGTTTEFHQTQPSYIEKLTEQFERIYTIVRELRQKGIAIN